MNQLHEAIRVSLVSGNSPRRVIHNRSTVCDRDVQSILGVLSIDCSVTPAFSPFVSSDSPVSVMYMIFRASLRRSTVVLGLAVLCAAASTAQAQMVVCDPMPVLPEQSVPGAFDREVATMLRGEADFSKPNCEARTPRALRVARLLKPIAGAARDIGASTRFLVLNKNEENAFAKGWPDRGYHLIVVYSGMIETLDRRAALAATRSGRNAAELGDVFLSTVLAHEMSHLVLRHSQDTNCRRVNGLVVSEAPVTRVGTEKRAEGTVVNAPGIVECKQYSQGKELAADSMAAFLVFASRKNNVFSDAGELVRLWEMDAAEERASGENAFWGERVMSTHPSALRRAALYLRLWSSMLEEQDRYDSAIGLISANIEVDRGIAMLDSVRRALPGAPFIDEAMGAALLTQWLATVPVDALVMRPTVGVVRTRFVEGLRGDNSGDASLLARARTALDAIRDVDSRPMSLSNLALLDAYSGNATRGLVRAKRAAQLAPSDASVLNTLGIAYYQAGQTDSARAVFGRIIVNGGGDQLNETAWRSSCTTDKTKPMSTRVCFNYARALYERDKALGLTLLTAYADRYGQQPWGREAARVASGARSTSGGSGTVGSGNGGSSGNTGGSSSTGGSSGTGTGSGGGTSAPRPTRPAPSNPSGKLGNIGTLRAITLTSPDGLQRIETGMRPRDARVGLPGVAEIAGSAGDGRVLQSEEAGVGLLVKADPAGGERVVGIVSSGSWSIAGVAPGQPISVLSRLGRVVDRDEDTYLFVVTGHSVRVVTDGTVIKTITVRNDQ